MPERQRRPEPERERRPRPGPGPDEDQFDPFDDADEIIDLAGGAVVDRDGVALLGNIERQVGSHHCEPDQADIGRRHRILHNFASVFLCAAFLARAGADCHPKAVPGP